MDAAYARKLLDDTFREVALVFGGIFAVHEVPDEAVWQLMKHLDIAHGNALAKLDGIEPGPDRPASPRHGFETHPAVEALLLKLKRRRPLHEEEP